MKKLFRVCLPEDVHGKSMVYLMDFFLSGPLPTRTPAITRMEAKARQSEVDEDSLFTRVDDAMIYLQKAMDDIGKPDLRLVYNFTGYTTSDYDISFEWDDVERDDEMADRVNKLAQEVQKETENREKDKIKKADLKVFNDLKRKHGW